jgi:hypothetical protein
MAGFKFKQGQTTRVEIDGKVRWARIVSRDTLAPVPGPGGAGTGCKPATVMREYVVSVEGFGEVTVAEEVLLRWRMAAIERSVAWFGQTRQGISEAIKRPRRGLRR